ncbi:PD-(D/E)XK motif protein [Crenobacter sp. SG2303]|uniref:PD-(D/E)XK motif protein n=1 Tax=Crenobacter oryzisoli TaxID=3056844 RepID=A0ABT7XP65_9NEIS|nr:PD-(D/E)XK motif protein [Crenobacter sp. SG2303]MDN0075488.1 PD-(D/E)XK motif protein [Crenobacter sp. SG2303]
MARPIDEFILAWGALSGDSREAGWRSIPVASAGPCVLMAGRRFPGNEEALLAGFRSAKVPAAEKLPEGRGFEVTRADPYGDGKTWISLTRKESGSVELFAEMVGDVAGAMDTAAAAGEEGVLRTLLIRVRAWQEFMRKGVQALSPEAELGLFGELTLLGTLMDAGVSSFTAVESWVGPLDGAQDFALGDGAVEAKATLSDRSFPAKIGCMEQLDDSVLRPIFLAGMRFALRESGTSLPELAADIAGRLSGLPDAATAFSARLLAAGYHASHADTYRRRFSLEKTRVLEVGEGFPRIVRGTVPDAITRVMYEIDLDRIPGGDSEVGGALKKLGVL